MKQLTIYRALLYLFLPVAGLLGVTTLFLFFVALMSPSVFLPVFVFGSIVIYVITSFIFLKKGIDQNRPCKAGLRDWIRVNAFVSIVFSIMFIIQSVSLLSHPQLMNEALAKVATMQTGVPAGSEALALKSMKGVMYFFTGFFLLLFLHTLLSFRIVKQYGYLFSENA